MRRVLLNKETHEPQFKIIKLLEIYIREDF